jgi:hypothetical protein
MNPPNIGQDVLVLFEKKVLVLCTIIDAKSEYGHNRFQVEPKNGMGRLWINEERIGAPEGEIR